MPLFLIGELYVIKLTSKIETFIFNIDDHCVKLEFKDKKFQEADFSFKGSYNRKQWDVLEKINKTISFIENKYNPDKPLIEKIKEQNHL
jgi:hypothetical protein